MLKAGCVLLSLLAAGLALPLNKEMEKSIFFKDKVPQIIGGIHAGPVPHMVALVTGAITRTLFCGASLISNRHVLTAAHCIDSLSRGGALLSSLRGVVGSHRWNIGGTPYIFSNGIKHPNYNDETVENDIGILVTSSIVRFNANVQPVVLNFDFIPGNAASIVNGWGVIDFKTMETARRLMELRPHIVGGEQCKADLGRVSQEIGIYLPPLDPELQICAFYRDRTGACRGDSGSPLLLQENKQQIGIVSWGIPCALGAPDVYARVSAYKSWIQQIIQ